jgi:hypothetical protein
LSRRLLFRLLVALSLVWATWAGWSLASGATPVTVSVVDDVGAPVAGAELWHGDTLVGTTSDTGEATIDWTGGARALAVTAPGYPMLQIAVLGQPEDSMEAVLRPQLLRGRIVDPDGRAVEGAYVTSSAGTSVTNLNGQFTLRKAEPGPVQVWRPAWEGAVFEWDGSPGEEAVAIAPETMKAVHINGDAAEERWSEFVALAQTTELNSLMLDLKDETGAVLYDTSVALAQQIGAVTPKYDLQQVVIDAERAGIYLIGRIVSFQDPIAAIRVPDLAVWDSVAGAAYSYNGQYFLDPTDPMSQAYALDLAVEACAAGVHEIQFDYVRFPDNRRDGAVFDGGVSEDVRIATIRDFLATAVAELHPLGCAVAADIFGFITKAVDDGGIGQQWEEVTSVIDVASPMLYPSHYASGWYGFQNPVDYPAALVGYALDDGLGRLARQIVVRPWLQDFGYDAGQVRAQIEEANSRGLGWMLWNAQSNVTVDALLLE